MLQPKPHLAPAHGGTPAKPIGTTPTTAPGQRTVFGAQPNTAIRTVGKLKRHLAPTAPKASHPRPNPSVIPNQATSYAGGPAAYTSGSGMRNKGR